MGSGTLGHISSNLVGGMTGQDPALETHQIIAHAALIRDSSLNLFQP